MDDIKSRVCRARRPPPGGPRRRASEPRSRAARRRSRALENDPAARARPKARGRLAHRCERSRWETMSRRRRTTFEPGGCNGCAERMRGGGGDRRSLWAGGGGPDRAGGPQRGVLRSVDMTTPRAGELCAEPGREDCTPLTEAGRGPFVDVARRRGRRRMKALASAATRCSSGPGTCGPGIPSLDASRLRVVVTHAGEGSSRRRGCSIRAGRRSHRGARGHDAGGQSESSAEPRDAGRARAVRRVDVLEPVDWLGEERGCRMVLCEGRRRADGAALRGACGGRALPHPGTAHPRRLEAPTLAAGDGFEPDAVPDGRLVSCDRIGDELYLMYSFAWTEDTLTAR